MTSSLPVVAWGELRVPVPTAADRERAWAVYTEPELRARWFRLPGRTERRELDFREGGHELLTGSFPQEGRPDELLENRSRSVEIVPFERIVWLAEIRVDGLVRLASLATTRFVSTEIGTELVQEERFAVFAATDGERETALAERRGGTRLQLNGYRAVADGRT
jgi:uncharacterized protein YndB with AHSA1/START domain